MTIFPSTVNVLIIDEEYSKIYVFKIFLKYKIKEKTWIHCIVLYRAYAVLWWKPWQGALRSCPIHNLQQNQRKYLPFLLRNLAKFIDS